MREIMITAAKPVPRDTNTENHHKSNSGQTTTTITKQNLFSGFVYNAPKNRIVTCSALH
jgi:hypothetical protein